MKDRELRKSIDEALTLDRDISRKAARLKELKAAIVKAAAGRKGEHVATENGGRAWRCEGESGDVCNVVFPAPTIRAAITGEAVEAVRRLAGKAFAALFAPVESLKPVPDFRGRAAAALGKKAAPLIAACENESAPRVSFETKRIHAPGME